MADLIIASSSLQQIEDTFEIRRVLEPLAAKRIFSHCAETDIDELESIVDHEEEMIDEKDFTNIPPEYGISSYFFSALRQRTPGGND